MANSFSLPVAVRHVSVLDMTRPRPVKLSLAQRELEQAKCRVGIGRAVERAVNLVWDSDKEAADEIGVDRAELGKWFSGLRRPHFDRMFAVQRLTWPLLVSLSSLDRDAQIEERIVRRRVSA